jgi:hypothetical protein
MTCSPDTCESSQCESNDQPHPNLRIQWQPLQKAGLRRIAFFQLKVSVGVSAEFENSLWIVDSNFSISLDMCL